MKKATPNTTVFGVLTLRFPSRSLPRFNAPLTSFKVRKLCIELSIAQAIEIFLGDLTIANWDADQFLDLKDLFLSRHDDDTLFLFFSHRASRLSIRAISRLSQSVHFAKSDDGSP